MPLTPGKRGRGGQRDRARCLARTSGLCEHRLDEGVTRLADIVDHTIPLAKRGPDEDWNTRNLCREHAAAGPMRVPQENERMAAIKERAARPERPLSRRTALLRRGPGRSRSIVTV